MYSPFYPDKPRVLPRTARGRQERCCRGPLWGAARERGTRQNFRRQQGLLDTTVTLRRDDCREERFRIVGEDEADPTRGTLSPVSSPPMVQEDAALTAGPDVRWGASFGLRPRASSNLNARTRRSQPSPADDQSVNHENHDCANHRYKQTP
jgi:hypothetical protein